MSQPPLNTNFINLTLDNIRSEHLSCIIRSKKVHPGIESKRKWLSERIKEGHVFRKLNAKGTAFIEYSPLEKAWVPIIGENFYYLYCLWVDGEYKGKGYASSLLEYCIEDAKENGKSGICMLGSKNQKHWLSDQSFAQKYGFKTIEETDNDYKLLSLSLDGTKPKFSTNVNKNRIENQELTIFYSMQCPFIIQSIETIKKYCEEQKIEYSLNEIDTLKKAKELPCVFNNFGVFYKGQFQTVNLLLDIESIKRIIRK